MVKKISSKTAYLRHDKIQSNSNCRDWGAEPGRQGPAVLVRQFPQARGLAQSVKAKRLELFRYSSSTSICQRPHLCPILFYQITVQQMFFAPRGDLTYLNSQPSSFEKYSKSWYYFASEQNCFHRIKIFNLLGFPLKFTWQYSVVNKQPHLYVESFNLYPVCSLSEEQSIIDYRSNGFIIPEENIKVSR